MLIALIADIHANREALSAVLAHARRIGVDRHVFLGDIVGYGPDPGFAVDTVAEFASRGSVVLKGNHDAAIADLTEQMNPVATYAIDWTRRQLSPAQRDFLAALPLAQEEEDRLYVHANAWAPGGWGYVLHERLAERSLGATRQRVTLCGHTHQPALYCETPGRPPTSFVPVPGKAVPLLPQRRWLAVIGSVGQPRDGVPCAGYAILQLPRAELTFQRVPYDVDATARKLRAAGLPEPLAARLLKGR